MAVETDGVFLYVVWRRGVGILGATGPADPLDLLLRNPFKPHVLGLGSIGDSHRLELVDEPS